MQLEAQFAQIANAFKPLTPFFAILSVPNFVWFLARVTPVASHPKFFAA